MCGDWAQWALFLGAQLNYLHARGSWPQRIIYYLYIFTAPRLKSKKRSAKGLDKRPYLTSVDESFFMFYAWGLELSLIHI